MSARFPARRSRGGDAAALIGGLLVVIGVAALAYGASGEPGPGTLVLAIVAVVLAAVGVFLMVWGFAYQTLAYSLTDNALRIEWLGYTTIVPYQSIHGIYTGHRLEGHATPSSPRWPGISIGSSRVRGLGRLRFFATSTDQSLLTLITVEHGGVIVSAPDPQEFRATLIERVERFGDTMAADEETWHTTQPSAAPWTAVVDPWLPLSVGVALLVLLLILGSIDLRYAALADSLPLHTDVTGSPIQIAKQDLFHIPLLGFVCLMVNAALGIAVHPRERLLARLLWLGGAVVQFIVLLGVLRLVA